MSDSPSDVRWPAAAAAGGELDWIERDGVFVGVDAGTGLIGFDDLDLEHLLPTSCNSADCARSARSNILPNDFSHCPGCGAAVARMFEATDRLWCFPSPDGDGLLNAESVTIRRVSEPVDGGLPAPEAYGLTFFVAGVPPRLFAADRMASTIYVLNRKTRVWRAIASTDHFDADLPQWAWSVHAFPGGFAMPGVNGPILARLDATGTELEIAPTPDKGDNLVSGAAGVERLILFLRRGGDTGLEVLGYDSQAGIWSVRVPVAKVPDDLAVDTAFATHVWKAPTLFWPGPSGYVALRVTRSGVEAEWRNWSDGFTPQLAIRPLWAQQAFWQFGSDGDKLLFECLAFKGGHRFHEVFATHLTAGECTFTSGMKRYAVPWDESTGHTVGRGDSFLMPICGIAGLGALVADCGFDPNMNRVNPGELLLPTAPLRPAKLLVHQSEGLQLDLRRSIRVGSLTQLQCIVFDNQLLIYDRESGIIEAWDIA